jgi:hypothetical protein
MPSHLAESPPTPLRLSKFQDAYTAHLRKNAQPSTRSLTLKQRPHFHAEVMPPSINRGAVQAKPVLTLEFINWKPPWPNQGTLPSSPELFSLTHHLLISPTAYTHNAPRNSCCCLGHL